MVGGRGILLQLGGSFLVGLVLELERTNALLEPLEYHEEGGHYEYLDGGTDEPTSHGGGTQSLVTVLAYTLSKHQWQQTDNHGQ